MRVLARGFGEPGGADRLLSCPFGLRFTADGTGLVVADQGNDRLAVFRVEDGSFVRHAATGLGQPLDVEECEGGWLVACEGTYSVDFVPLELVGEGSAGSGSASLGQCGSSGEGEFWYPLALALVPGLGLVVREAYDGDRVHVLATPDAVAMHSMSVARVGWMVAVGRSLVRVTAVAGTRALPDPRVCTNNVLPSSHLYRTCWCPHHQVKCSTRAVPPPLVTAAWVFAACITAACLPSHFHGF